MNPRLIILSLLFSVCLSSCFIAESIYLRNQTNYIKGINSINKNDSTYIEVKKALVDTINSWVNSKKMHLEIAFFSDDYHWKLDEHVFFNSTKTRCVLMILILNTDHIKSNAVRMISGEIINEKWQFYYLGHMETSYVTSNNIPETYSALSNDGIEVMLQLGYYKRLSHKVDDKLFNANWFRDDIIRMHYNKFLKNK